MKPFFCIIITNFNKEKEILRCIKSCLSQTFKDFYILVIDDNSTDNSVKKIKKLCIKKIKIIQNKKNKGVCYSRHKAIKSSEAEWIVNLDADWKLKDKNVLENLKKKIIQYSNQKLNFFGARIKFDYGLITPLNKYKKELNYLDRVKMVNEDQYDFLKIFRKKIYNKYCYWPVNKRFADGLIGLNWHKHNKIKIFNYIAIIQYTKKKTSLSRISHFNFTSFYALIIRDASHRIWEYEKVLKLHGKNIKIYAPNYYQILYFVLGMNYFFLNKKKKGLLNLIKSINNNVFSLKKWIVLIFGLLNNKLLIFMYRINLNLANR